MGKPRSKGSSGKKGAGKGARKGSGKGKGASAGSSQPVLKKGKLKAGGKDGGGKGGGDSKDKGKGKGKGKGKSSTPVGSRKERKKAAVARSKGLPVPGQEKKAPAKPAPVLGDKKVSKKKKKSRAGQKKRKGEDPKSGKVNGFKKAEEQEEKTKKKRPRIRNRRKKSKGDGDDDVIESKAPPPLLCRSGHSMGQRSDNPPGYQNMACCDVCGKEKLAKKCSHFFHCSFCRFDMCLACASTWQPELTADRKQKRRKEKPSAEQKAKPEGVVGSKERREIWIPSEADSVNRAPVSVDVVSDWVEGQPV